MAFSPADDIFAEPFWIALLFLVVAGAAILGALGFQHLGGYQPCALCLMQRTPYYVDIPVALATVVAIRAGVQQQFVALLFAILAVLALYNAGLGAYHAGVEWRWWPGPASCAPSVAIESAGSVLGSIKGGMHAPSCTDALWRFAGLSFAGWNVVISLALAALATLGAWRSLYGSSSASQYR